jgi:hypothetical protein
MFMTETVGACILKPDTKHISAVRGHWKQKVVKILTMALEFSIACSSAQKVSVDFYCENTTFALIATENMD